MARFRGLLSAALLLMLLPLAAAAQDDNDFTREATKHIGLAMTRQDEAERLEMYRQALVELEKSMAEEPDHAKTWYLAGAVYAALGQFAEADAAFDKAVELYPEYQAEIATEREQAWIHAFNAGIAAMDAGDNAAAITAMEAANELYSDRPEAYLNLGSLYANQGETAKAVEALQGAVAVLESPIMQEVTPETQAQWTEYAEMARINIAQLSGQAGIEAFQAQDYPVAAEMFKAAAEQNPHSRDFRYNYVQALFAQVQDLEAARDSVLEISESATGAAKTAATTQVEAYEAELLPLYDQLLAGFDQVKPVDPNNEMLYVIAANAHRQKGVLLGAEEAVREGQTKALELLTERDQLPVYLNQLAMRTENDTALITGTLTNHSATANAPVVVQLTLLGIDGNPVGQGEITVTAPAADAETTFEGSIPVTGEIAGWKYQVRS